MAQSEPIRVLLVEDNPTDAFLLQETLADVPFATFAITQVERLTTALNRLQEGGVDVVLSDLGLPDSNGLDALQALIAEAPAVPIIVLTGLADEELGLRALQNGAEDYFVKGQFSGQMLARATRYAIERKRTTETVRKSLHEKEVLLKEIHHRVKNNMQVISSLLQLQSQYIKDATLRAMFAESQNRIKSMALIHEKLYQSQDIGHINFCDYLSSLVRMIARSYPTKAHSVKMEVHCEPVALTIDTGVPLGLIVNELLSNSLKHAFPGERSGHLQVNLKPQDQGGYELMMRDNGVGLPAGFSLDNTSSLGLRLVKILTSQLGAQLTIKSEGGAEFSLNFREVKV